MKKLPLMLLISTALTVSACDGIGKQWIDPDKTFALFKQPDVKGVNDTQEDMAKEAAAAADYKRAAGFYDQLATSGKGTPEQVLRYKLGLADSLRRLGDNETALRVYEEVYKANPANMDAAEGRGLTLMATGKVSDAGRAFQEVLEKDPKRWRTLNALGILFVTKSMIPEAMAYYGEALANSPDNAAVLNNVGLSQATDRNFPRAIEALEQAARVSKIPAQKKQIELNLAMVYGVSGDFDKAREVASRYLEGPGLDNNLGLYAYLAKDEALAKTYLNMALSGSPVFYERAWTNLDVINDVGESGEKPAKSVDGVKTSSPAKTLPKLDVLQTPSEPVKKEKPRSEGGKGKKAKRGEAKPTVEELEPAIAVPLTQMGDPEPLPPVVIPPKAAPAAKATGEKAGDKPADKPSGLIIGPSEGD